MATNTKYTKQMNICMTYWLRFRFIYIIVPLFINISMISSHLYVEREDSNLYMVTHFLKTLVCRKYRKSITKT